MSRRDVGFSDPQLVGLHRFVQALVHSQDPHVRAEVDAALGDVPRRDVLGAAGQLQAAVAARHLESAIGAGR